MNWDWEIFVSTFAGGAGSIIATASLGGLIYWGKKYLKNREYFDIFSRNILKTKEDAINLFNELMDRIDIAKQIHTQCNYLDMETNDFLSHIQKILDNVEKEKINPTIFTLWNEYPNLLQVRNDFLKEGIIFKMNDLKESLFAVPPKHPQTNSLFPPLIPKYTSLKDFDYEKLGFLTSKHRSIIELYEEALKVSNAVENCHKQINSILSTLSENKGPKIDRKFIRNVVIKYFNLEISIQKLLPILNELIKENNLVREDFRLQSIPVVESTFRKASFWKIPILWFFRWFK